MTSAKQKKETKEKKDLDLCELTDVLVVLPREQWKAIVDSLYFTLEHSTSDDFDTGVRRDMLSAIKRLE